MLVWTIFSIWPYEAAPVLWNKNYKHENVISSLIKICKNPYVDSGETHIPSFPTACAYIKHWTCLKTQLIYQSARAYVFKKLLRHNYKLRNSKMDKAAQDNRTNQCNPTHKSTGPGHQAGYHGTGTKADLDNRSNQMNPNNPLYKK